MAGTKKQKETDVKADTERRPLMKANAETIRRPEYLEELHKVAEKGYTMKQIADHFGIDRTTLYAWSKKYPEVQGALDSGKVIADERVEQALYESCFPHDEKEITIEKDENGNIVKQIVRTKHIPANLTAIQYWLSNRANDRWKARQQLDIAGVPDAPVVIVNDLEATKDLPFKPKKKEDN